MAVDPRLFSRQHGLRPVYAAEGSNFIGIEGKNLRPHELGNLRHNIKTIAQMATPEQVQAGDEWYDIAQDEADRLSPRDLNMGAGIIAAASPQKEWTNNLEIAKRVMKSGDIRGLTGQNAIKALRIRSGENPEDVLPMRIKTGQFYHNIKDPNNPHFLTVDTHAHNIAVGHVYNKEDLGLDSYGRYDTVKNAYMHVANQLGITNPNRLQARTWVTWKGLDRPKRTYR
jgi:hypothetical protein